MARALLYKRSQNRPRRFRQVLAVKSAGNSSVDIMVSRR